MVAVPARWCCFLAFCCQAEASCFQHAVPEHALKALADLTAGNPYPIGIWVNDWAASHLAANVAQIVIQETQMDPECSHGALECFTFVVPAFVFFLIIEPCECFSRMRSEGFPFIVGGLGVGPVFASRVSRRRFLSFVFVSGRRAAVITCLGEKLQNASFLEVASVT